MASLRTTLLLALVLALTMGAASCRQAPRGALGPAPLPTETSTPLTDTSAPTALPTHAVPAPTPTTTAPTPTTPPSPTPALSGPLVAIDAGHGGEDLGACHVDTAGRLVLTESEANLAIALCLRDVLQARGVRVLMLREEDTEVNVKGEDVNGNGVVDYRDDLQARVDTVNAAGATLLLSIHQNAYVYAPGVLARDVGGTVTYYSDQRPFADDSYRLASLVQDAVVAALTEYGYSPDDRGVRPDGELGGHLILLGPVSENIARASEMPGALSETLFITHDQEVQLLGDPEVHRVLAEAYADAIVAYLAGE